jgi:hypothetical protein
MNHDEIQERALDIHLFHGLPVHKIGNAFRRTFRAARHVISCLKDGFGLTRDWRQEKRLAMHKSILLLLDLNATTLSRIPVLRSMRDELFRYIEMIDAEFRVRRACRKSVKTRRYEAEEEAFDLLIPVCFALYCFAKRTNNTELMEKTLFDEPALRKCRTADLLRKSQGIAEEAFAHEKNLERYGICREMVIELELRMNRYGFLAGAPGILSVERTGTSRAISAYLAKADELVAEDLDRIMELLRFTNPRLYNEYHSARDRHETILGLRSRRENWPQPHPAS